MLRTFARTFRIRTFGAQTQWHHGQGNRIFQSVAVAAFVDAGRLLNDEATAAADLDFGGRGRVRHRRDDGDVGRTSVVSLLPRQAAGACLHCGRGLSVFDELRFSVAAVVVGIWN